MTEPIMAPLPPEMKETNLQEQSPSTAPIPPPEQGQQTSVQNSVEEKPEPVWKKNLQDLKEKMIPKFWYVLGGSFLAGLLMGMLFSGSGEPVPVQQPQQQKFRSVPNPDIRTHLKPCGVTGNDWEECVLYLVNYYPQERKVRDFFDRAASMTGAPPYSLDSANTTYREIRVQPGYLMEIKIPPRRQ